MENIKDTQVFTPPHITNQMLDLLVKDRGDDSFFADEEIYFFEPSCGDGQMLEVICERIWNALLKHYNSDKNKAFADCMHKFYAIDLDEEMVLKCRIRMFDFFMHKITDDMNLDELIQYLVARQLKYRVEHGNTLKVMEKSNLKRRVG